MGDLSIDLLLREDRAIVLIDAIEETPGRPEAPALPRRPHPLRGRNTADLRLLSRCAIASALLALACETTRTEVVHIPRVAGRVIDHETREPVAGAEVFVSWYAGTLHAGHAGASAFFGTRWTTTDAEGRFDFPSKDTPVPKGIQRWERLGSEPGVVVIHPRYGRARNAAEITDFSNIDWEAVVDEYTHDFVERQTGAGLLCDTFNGAGQSRCCEVFFGPDHVCVPKTGKPQWGAGSPQLC